MESAIKYHSNCFDEGLSPETLGLETLYSGKFTSSTQAIKPNFVLQHSPPTQHHSFVRNRPPVLHIAHYYTATKYFS